VVARDQARLQRRANAAYADHVGLAGDAGGAEVATGVFGAYMQVSSTNDGPVTLILDSAG
jgi:D-Tyr-tRNAtyr deacylase